MENKDFVFGVRVSKPFYKAPKFVVAQLVINVSDFIQKYEGNDEIKIDIKESKGGNYYAQLDTYQHVHSFKAELKTPEATE
jgi:hypothetical protein